jgi:hypothetical protein
MLTSQRNFKKLLSLIEAMALPLLRALNLGILDALLSRRSNLINSTIATVNTQRWLNFCYINRRRARSLIWTKSDVIEAWPPRIGYICINMVIPILNYCLLYFSLIATNYCLLSIVFWTLYFTNQMCGQHKCIKHFYFSKWLFPGSSRPTLRQILKTTNSRGKNRRLAHFFPT